MVGHNARFLHEPCMVLGGARPCADVSLKNPFQKCSKVFFSALASRSCFGAAVSVAAERSCNSVFANRSGKAA